MSLFDIFKGNSQQESKPKIDPASKTRVENELAVARFQGTESDRIEFAKSLGINQRDVSEIIRTYTLRNDLNLAHDAQKNAARDRELANNDERAKNPLKIPRGTIS